MYKVLTQVWRVVRIFLLAFIAQLVAQGVSVDHLSQKALIAAGVAAAEAVYRQVVEPDSKNGTLARLIVAYKQITAVTQTPIVKATEADAVAAVKTAGAPPIDLPVPQGAPAPSIITGSAPIS